MSDDPSAGYFAQARPPAPTYPSSVPPAYPGDPAGVRSWQGAPARAAGQERPGAVVVAAVIALVQAGLVLLGAAALAVLAFGARSALGDLDSNLSGLSAALGIIALLIGGVAALVVLAAFSLLRGRLWAAIVLAVVESLVLLSALSDLAGQVGVGSLFGAGCAAAVLVLLLLPRSREFVGVS